MKRNSIVQLSPAWWRDNEPKGLTHGKEFAKALAEHEVAHLALKKTGAQAALDACVKALATMDTVAAKILAEANKLAKTPPKDPKKPTHDTEEMGWTADAFKKIDKVLDDARAQAKAALKPTAPPAAPPPPEKEPDDKSVLGSEDAFKQYLKTQLMQLRKGPMNMAIAPGKDPLDTRALLHRTNTGRSLAARLAKETGIKKVTWGVATASTEDASAIVLTVEGPKVSGLKKVGERMLKTFRPQPFSTLTVMVEGKEDQSEEDEAAADSPPGDGDAQQRFTERLKALAPALTKAAQEGVKGADAARLKASEAGVLARKLDFASALALLEEAEKQLRAALTSLRAPPVKPVQEATSSSTTGFSLVNLQKSRLAWLATRKSVKEQLQKLESTIVAELKGDPDVPNLSSDIRKLDEVLQRLDERLADKLDEALNASDPKVRQRLHQEASALMTAYRDYVSRDAFVAELETNPFMPLALRTTVLGTLTAMQKTLGSAPV